MFEKSAYCRLGRKRGRSVAMTGPGWTEKPMEEAEYPPKPEIDGTARYELQHPEAELSSTGKSEMSAPHGRSELPGS